jgi:hypothetical protein
MPNHVFNHISVEEQYADKLQEIAKVGLCRYYRPMPEELDVHKYYDKTHDNPYGDDWGRFQNEQKEWIIKQKASNLKRYGSEDWYDWAINNWGTKWGCYEPHGDDTSYNFQTAWSPPSREIFEMLAKDIPNFYYDWEEEQGYGAIWNCVDGRLELEHEWDFPEWSTKKWDELTGNMYDDSRQNLYGHGCVTLLKEDYRNMQGSFKRGYYLDYMLGEFLHKDFRTAVDKLKQRHKKWKSMRPN